jgi:predicted O-methyltransferase YrrM
MDTLCLILAKYKLTLQDKIEIPNVNRNDLIDLLHEFNFKVGVEIGVQTGLYSEIICQKNPQMMLYGVDAWRAYIANPNIGDLTSQKTADRYFGITKKNMKKYPNYRIIKAWSRDAVKRFKNNSIDFVYIDADHEYCHALEDITIWTKKVRKGGIVSGHDYYNTRSMSRIAVGVKNAVNIYVKENNIKPLIIWGLNARISDFKQDKWKSWSFIKP